MEFMRAMRDWMQIEANDMVARDKPDYSTFRTGAVNTHDYIILLYSKPTMPPKKAPVQPKSGPKITGKQSAKHSVKDLRKQASAIKKRECPATSKMNRKELISYIEKHR